MQIIVVILFILLLIYLTIFVPYQMATTRGRSVPLWVALSVVFSPVIAIPALLFLGEAQAKTRGGTNN